MVRTLLPAALCVVALGGSPAAADKPAPAPVKKGTAPAPATPAADDLVDTSAFRADLRLLTDGKGHYVAVVPFKATDEDRLFYGDAHDLYAQRVFGGGSEGDVSFDVVYWEPRVDAPYKAAFGFKDGKYTVQCDERITQLKPVPDAEAAKLLGAAKLHKPRWKTRAYALARDRKGTYYYVDREREPATSKRFRLWAGPKGDLKPLKMVNVVSDSAGDIFATKSGELRLVVEPQETLWVEKEKETKLVPLPVEDNARLIYSELGVYAGEPLGTPCDEL